LSQLLTHLHEQTGDPSQGAGLIDLSFLRPPSKPGLLGTLGRYEVQQVIARGGMGTVLKALDPILHRVVAIKVLNHATSATARQRFLWEARAVAALCDDPISFAFTALKNQSVFSTW
jgi:serine/threonine-protein kinase